MNRYFFLLLLLLSACYRDKENCVAPPRVKNEHPLFQLLPADSTGITFANILLDTGKYHFDTLINLCYGGGVAVGDINNDGLIDIFFTSNEGKSRLYLNLGNFHFRDITDSAGIDTRGGWTTGAVMADVNGDGLMDIYVCRGGMAPDSGTRNLLYINKGNMRFSEEAMQYGIADAGLTTSASFFDYDNDGDLDLYTLNYPVFIGDPLNFSFYKTTKADSVISDKLFENTGGKFRDVSARAGLPIEKGSGLGLVVADINQDGWPDIYVDNDWLMNDYVYINQKNGTFKDENAHMFSKNSFFSMGCEVADVTNDGLPDILTTDMAPTNHYRRNTHQNDVPIDYYFLEKEYGQKLQYSRNLLQINNGNNTFNDRGEQAGISRTDWSWSALLADFDNDGWKDIYISKGLKRDDGDKDFDKLMYAEKDKTQYAHDKKLLFTHPRRYLHANYAFKNYNGTNFLQVMDAWGLNQLVNTQGAAYADLDNDGKLDLIINNVDTTAFIYRNTGGGDHNHYLRISVAGEKKNTVGLGTKAWLYNKGKVQYNELSNARGFQSSSEPILHFGLGKDSVLDSVLVVFPSFKYTVLRNVKADQLIKISEAAATGARFNYAGNKKADYLLENHTEQINPSFVHHESDFNDFKDDKLIPRMFSKEGPPLAAGDLNGDGLDDFYVGGAAGQAGAIYLQQKDGTFALKPETELAKDTLSEAVAALIIDLNSDGKPDLYVVNGSNEFPTNDTRYQDRIYLNDGKGNLRRCTDCLPDMTGSKSCIAAYDFDGDGYVDLFIGGRTVPHSYGVLPRSYLLHNNGHGKFTDVTAQIAPALEYAGMVTAAQWIPMAKGKKASLLVTGDWMSPSVYNYQNGKLENITASTGLQNYTGWWNSITVGDFNSDGLTDFACGNWGLNSIWKANANEPLSLLVNDFDNNGSVDPILCCYLEHKNGTFLGRDLICKSMPKFFNKFFTYHSFADCRVEDIFPKDAYLKAQKLKAVELRTCVFMNSGNGTFTKVVLPDECQAAPVNKIIARDMDGDGKTDLLLLGNTNQNYFDQGDIDALSGVLLHGNGTGNFTVVPRNQCCIAISKFVRSAETIQSADHTSLLIGCNNDSLLLYRFKH